MSDVSVVHSLMNEIYRHVDSPVVLTKSNEVMGGYLGVFVASVELPDGNSVSMTSPWPEGALKALLSVLEKRERRNG